jgi:hypothetical protein
LFLSQNGRSQRCEVVKVQMKRKSASERKSASKAQERKQSARAQQRKQSARAQQRKQSAEAQAKRSRKTRKGRLTGRRAVSGASANGAW